MSSKVTYRQQFTRCGKQRCRKCKEGAGHGPYWYAYWSVKGRTVSKYIGKHPPENVEIETKTSQPQQTHSPLDDTASLPPPPLLQPKVQKDILVETPLPTTNSPTSNIEGASGKQPALRIYLLGQFRIERRQDNKWQPVAGRMWQRRRARALLGCLLSNAGRRLGREQTMEALWPDLDIETAANRLNGAVHEARQILEPELARPAASKMLRLERDVLQLAGADQLWVDADIFEGLLTKANGSPDPAQAEQILEEAARLYGGDYLLEELYSEWAASRREALRRGWIGLLLNLAELRASRGALASAIEPLERLLATDPTHETAVRRMMLLLTRLDRRGEALHIYHRLAHSLQRDYESDPLPETHELYEALRQGYMQVSNPIAPQPTANQATTIPGEVQNELDSPPAPAIHQRMIQALSRPVLQLGRQNQSPLVGRDQELMIMRQLLLALQDASLQNAQKGHSDEIVQPVKRRTGDGQGKQKNSHFLLLMGESGIGKTRLAEELSQEANALGWSVAWTRAYEQESAIPFRPWTEVLRTLLQDATPEFLKSSAETRLVLSDDGASDSMHYASSMNSKLAKLSALVPELASYDTLTPPHDASSLPPEQERLHLWEATLALLNALGRVTPILLVLDDLHWTDDSSLELLAYLVRHLQDERVLLVGTCRDVELTANSNLRTLITDLRREQSVVTLSLQPLTQSQIGSLVAYLPKDIVQSIQIHAGGNPFFAEELARVSETSFLSSAKPPTEIALNSQFNALSEEVPGGINRIVTLPETIAAVLERRLSKLSSDCLALLGRAAVLGGSFEFNQLLFMAGDPGSKEDAMLDLLEEALRAGLLTEEGTGACITYHFWHPLIVSHLYEHLSAARRAQMHRRAADALLHIHQGHEAEAAGAITYHLSKGGGDPGQIARYAEIAGDRAFSLPAYSEAEHFYRQAIEAITGEHSSTGAPPGADPLHLAYLLEQVAECSFVKGNYDEVRALYERVLELRNQYQVTAQASLLTQKSDAEALLWRQQEAQIQALIWHEIGRTWSETGDFVQARQCFKYGRQVMLETGVTSGAAWACLHLQQGNISWKEGNYNDARTYAQEALKMLTHVFEEQRVRDIDSQEEHPRNRPPSTTASQTRIARALVGDPLEVGHCHEILGIISASVGQYTEALKHLDTARALFEQHGLITALTQVYGNLGAVYAFKAENAVARTYFQRALELAERNGDLPDMAFVIGNLADVAARSGDLQEAEEWFKRSIALAERINDREHLCWCHVALASAIQDQGNLRVALEHIRRSLVLGRAMKSTRGIGFALVALGDWRVVQAVAISKIDIINLKEQTILQDSACYRFLLSARAALERALALEGLDAEVMTEGHLILARVYFFFGDLTTAQQKAYQTLEEARGHELTRVEARSQRLLGRILAAQNQHELADQYFEQALEVFNRYEMRLDYARTLHGFGVTLVWRSKPNEETFQRGLAYLHHARDLFRECGAAIDLDWVERTLANLEFQNVEAL